MIDTLPLAMLWRPYFPMAVTLTGAGALLLLAGWVCVRTTGNRPILSGATLVMRCLLVFGMALLLMGPSAERTAEDSLFKPTLQVLVDTSGSMLTRDMRGDSRFGFAREKWLSKDRLAKLRRTYDVELYAFDETRRRIDEEAIELADDGFATGGVSNIARAVRQSVGRQPDKGSAVLLLSDGRDTLDAPMSPAGELAASRQTPIYAVPLGGPSLSRDLAVIALPKQPYLFADEPGSIAVRVIQSNAGVESTLLHVEQGGDHRTFPIRFDGRSSAGIDVPITHGEPGNYAYRVWADPVTGEADEANNSQPVFIEVTAKRLRVLVLEGQPYWDTKFLSHALRKDTRIELTQVTQVSPDKRETIVSRQGAATGIPTTLEELGRFDVIVLGKDILNVLDAETIRLLPRYVSDHGGRLVFARGRAFDEDERGDAQALEALMLIEPVVFGRGKLHNRPIEPDPSGMMQPGFSPGALGNVTNELPGDNGLPRLLNLPVVEREKAAARVLARVRSTRVGQASDHESRGQPAIVTMPYGRGMVVAVLGEGLWQWGLRPRHGGRAENTYDRFWMDTVRWLALGSDYQPGKPISLQLSRLGVQVGDAVSIDVLSRTSLETQDIELTVEGPKGKISKSALSPIENSTTRMRAVVSPTTPGVYRVTARSARSLDDTYEARFNCYDVDIERMHNAANRGAMRALAETSGGRCLDPDDPDALPMILDRQREAVRNPPTVYYVWDRGWVMTLLLSWAGIEWIVRRLGGLL